MMSVVAHQHKKEALIATALLAVTAFGGGLFYLDDGFRLSVSDAYNSVFKLIITDRVLQKEALVFSNMPYCSSDNPRQTLDLYVPRDVKDAKTPLVVFIHGGGWRVGDKSNQLMTYYAETLLKQGVAVASINYRLYPEVTYPGPNDDVACAVNYLSNNAAQYNIRPDKWTLFGDSAGAQLGAYAMSDARANAPFSLFVGFYGPYDLLEQTTANNNRDSDARRYTNKAQDAAVASPILRAGKQGATYMLFHGNKDRVVPPSQSENFYKKLQSEQIYVTYQTVENAGHYFSPRSDPTANNIKNAVLNKIITGI